MRPVLLTALLAATCASIAPAAWSVPLLSMHYQIGSLSQTLEFMGDGSVRFCDGSVLVACDGSVLPVPGASFRTLGDGSVRDMTQLLLLGDGSVRTGSELPSDMDGILLSALTFSPNPFLEASVSIVDHGASTTFLMDFIGPLDLGTDEFDYTLEGSATLTDATGDGVSAGSVTAFGLSGIAIGAVDFVGLASLGSAGLSGDGAQSLGQKTGSGNCATCANQSLSIGLVGGGGGDQYVVNARLDLSAATAVPEPGTLGLLGLGLAVLFARRRQYL
jgi:hypothetical protein